MDVVTAGSPEVKVCQTRRQFVLGLVRFDVSESYLPLLEVNKQNQD